MEKTEQARGTHFLEAAEGGTRQDTERNQLRKENSPTGDHRERDLSGHGKKAAKPEALTNWRPHSEGIVRTRGHGKKLMSQGHSPSGDRRRDLSGHGKTVTKGHSRTGDRRRD